MRSTLPNIWLTISLEKQNKKLLIRTKDPKINCRFGGHCNLHTLSGLCKFCNLIRMKSSFPVFDKLLFRCILVFTKICHIILSSNKYPPCWNFKLAKSNQFKVDIKSKTVLTWNVKNSSKESMSNTDSFSDVNSQISNLIVEN